MLYVLVFSMFIFMNIVWLVVGLVITKSLPLSQYNISHHQTVAILYR
jgi:hypothetical protein